MNSRISCCESNHILEPEVRESNSSWLWALNEAKGRNWHPRVKVEKAHSLKTCLHITKIYKENRFFYETKIDIEYANYKYETSIFVIVQKNRRQRIFSFQAAEKKFNVGMIGIN